MPKDNINFSSRINILIDDILCCQISNEEQDQEIIKLTEKYLEELQKIAVKLVEKINQDIKDFKAEAEKRGYYPILIQEI